MTQIREYRPADVQAVVDLSLRAWTPVFASLERILGWELFTRLHGNGVGSRRRRCAVSSPMVPCTRGWQKPGPG